MKLTRVYNRGQKNDRNFVFKVLTKDNSQCRIIYRNKEKIIKKKRNKGIEDCDISQKDLLKTDLKKQEN